MDFARMRLVWVGVVVAIQAAVGSRAGAAFMQVIDLGTFTAPGSHAFDVNDHGQAVGYANVLNGGSRGFRTMPPSAITPQSNLGSLVPGGQSLARGINSAGQAVGNASLANGNSRAFRTGPNAPINPATDNLGTLGGDGSWGTAINSSGQVVGYSWPIETAGQTRAFRTAANAAINPLTDDLGSLGHPNAATHAYDINDSGQVVGTSAIVSSNNPRSFRTAPNAPINPATDELGLLGGADGATVALAINESGQVAGYSGANFSVSHAFRTAANAPINPLTDDLGTLGGSQSYAHDINDHGHVVGASRNAAGQLRAFLYTTSMIDLNTLINPASGWLLEEAQAINNNGDIVGTGIHNGQVRAFHLYVPEPGGAACGMMALAAMLRRKR